MNERVAIKYRGFWDVPRIFIAHYQEQTFLFDCPFDEGLDDYPDAYKVYLLPEIQEQDLPKDWTTLAAKGTRYLGEVPVSRVQFDPTKRQSIDAALLDEFAAQKVVD